MLFSLTNFPVKKLQSPALRAIAASADGEGATAWMLKPDDGPPRELLTVPRAGRVVVAFPRGRTVSLDSPTGDPHALAIVIVRLSGELAARPGRRERQARPEKRSTSRP